MAPAAGGLGGGGPGGGCGTAGCGGGACTGPWDVLGFDEQKVGVLVRGGIGAGCFPFDTGGVGSELACTGVVVRDVPACMAGLAGRLISRSFLMAVETVVSVLSNISWTRAVSSSSESAGVSEVLVPWKWTVLLLRYSQRFFSGLYLTSFPWYCPVPCNRYRLSIYSLFRKLAVRRSSLINSLSSKSRQGCEGPALQKISSSKFPNKKRCP